MKATISQLIIFLNFCMDVAQITSPPLTPDTMSSHKHVFLYRTWHLGKGSANYPSGPFSKTLCCANVLSVIASPSITFFMCADNLEGVEWCM